MSDDKPAATDFAGASANLRETAKWLVGGVVATSVGVLAGSPLTKLGTLELGQRLYLALGGAAVTLVLLGLLLWVGLSVIVTESVSLERLAALRGWEGLRVRRVAARFKGRWPGGANHIDGVLSRSRALFEAAEGKGPSDPAMRALVAFQDEVDQLMREVAFEYKRDRLNELRGTLLVLAPVIVLAIAVYAWAANPPDDPKPLSSQPRLTALTLDASDALTQSPALSAACYPSAEPGRIRLSLVVTAEYPGRTELITLPAVAGCVPVRLTEQNSRVFVPK